MAEPSAEQLRSLQSSLDLFSSRTRTRGLDYFKRGRVKRWEWDAAEVTFVGTVEGNQTYETYLVRDEEGFWDGECTCPVEEDCKHAYALGRTVLQSFSLGPQAVEAKKKAKPQTLLQETKAKSAQALGRTIDANERQLIMAVQDLFRDFGQYQGNYLTYALNRASRTLGGLAHSFPEGFFTRLGLYQKRPETGVEFLHYIIHQATVQHREIPAVWEMHLDEDYLRSAVRPFFLQFEIDQWAPSRFRNTYQPQQSSIQQPVDLRAEITPEGVFLRWKKAGSRSWSNPTKVWIEWLSNHPSPTHYKQLPPAAHAIAGVLAGYAARHYRPDPREPLSEEIVQDLFAYDPAHPAILLPDGTPFTIQREALQHKAWVKPEGDALAFALDAPGHSLKAAPHLIAHTPEPLYLADNKVFRGPPPLPSAELSFEALKVPAVTERLKSLAVALPESLEARFESVPLRPCLRCWLEPAFPEDPLRAQLHFELTAQHEALHQNLRSIGKHWEPAADHQPLPKGPDHPIYTHDFGTARAVAGALESLPAHFAPYHQAWVHAPHRDFAEHFRAFLAQLPPEARVEVSAPLKGLVDGPVTARLDFEIESDEKTDHDWFDLRLVLQASDATLSPEEIALLSQAKGRWIFLPRRGWTRLETSEDKAKRATLDAFGLSPEGLLSSGKEERHRLHALQLAPHAETLAPDQDAGWKARLKRRIRSLTTAKAPEPPKALTAELRPYQREGFQFLEHLDHCHLGGILADDMGLGKTVQSLAWLLAAAARHAKTAKKTKTKSKPKSPFRALVVCPKSVMHGWETECHRFAPGLEPSLFNPRADPAPAPQGPQLTIANYAQLRLNADHFSAIEWDAVILDEAQNIKNPRSKVAQTACALQTRHRLALTGTPIENRLLDLWSILQFAQPGLLGAQAQFKRQYPAEDPASTERLRRRVRHFMLRRTKSKVAPDMPSRTEDTLLVDLEPRQRKLYDAELKRARQHLLKIENEADFQAARFHVLASLLRLRQIACHPGLVDPAYDAHPSAKTNALLEKLIELRAEGHKILVFSQFTSLLDRLADELKIADLPHLILTGKTENRRELVERFQNDPEVGIFLLSLKAAGSGLNLTAASYVFLFDPWWNPAVEAQAIDRTHRIGQTQPVMAYRLIAKDTVEEKIRALQIEKAALAGQIVKEDSLAQVLDLESLQRLFA